MQRLTTLAVLTMLYLASPGPLAAEDRLDALRAKLLANPAAWAPSAEDRAFLADYDKQCAQKDCLLSRLHWHTDLQKALAESKASGKPILSLQLLGRLDEELSCANSRFFRVLYYSNRDISDHLRTNFVLHWRSVRPAPEISIDYGDGRKLKTTITGNSLHYILDSAGRPLDALPGLYSPKDFLAWLQSGRALLEAKDLTEYHRERLEQLRGTWTLRHVTAGLGQPRRALPIPLRPAAASGRGEPWIAVRNPVRAKAPSARRAGDMALSKAAVQSPMVLAISASGGPSEEKIGLREDPIWNALTNMKMVEGKTTWDKQSMALLQSQRPATGRKNIDPMSVVYRLNRSIAADSVWNEYAFHAHIHDWYASGTAPFTVEELNDRIYRELFLTPSDDPWLGLLSADAFTGVQDNGISGAAR